MFPKTFHNCNTVNRIKIKLHLSINTNLIFLKIRKCNNNVKLVAQHFRKIKLTVSQGERCHTFSENWH